MAWRAARSTIRSRRLLKNGSEPTSSAPGRACTIFAKAVSIAVSLLALKITTSLPTARAAVSDSRALDRSGCEMRVREHGEGRGRGNEIVQQPQALLGQFGREGVDTGRVAAGSGEAGEEPQLDRSGCGVEHDGDRRGRSLGRSGRSFAAHRDDDGDLAANEIGHQRRHPVVVALGPAILDHDVTVLDKPGFL